MSLDNPNIDTAAMWTLLTAFCSGVQRPQFSENGQPIEQKQHFLKADLLVSLAIPNNKDTQMNWQTYSQLKEVLFS